MVWILPKLSNYQQVAPATPDWRLRRTVIFIMTTINLKDFYYWYTQDQFIEVTEEVAEALRASVRYGHL